MCEEGGHENMEMEEIESEELRSERQQRILNVRKEKSRDAARNRRSKENTQYEELAKLLPFPPSVTSQLDKASIIRLTISFLKYHELLGKGPTQRKSVKGETPSSIFGEDLGAYLLQALDGFLFCITQDGKFIYISETVTTHLGLSQLDLIGTSVFSIIHPDDQKAFSEAINKNIPNSYPLLPYQYDDFNVMVPNEMQYNVPTTDDSISTFTRMKCALIKRSGCYVKSSGYKVIHVSGKFVPYRNFDRNTYYSRVLVATGQALPPPTICELKIDTKVFVSRITMSFDIVFCEGRIHKYLDFKARDIVGINAYQFYMAADMQKVIKGHYECLQNGKTVTSAYRWMNKYGGFVWMQTVGTVIKRQGPHGEESQILCVNYLSSDVVDDTSVTHKMQENFKRLQLEEKDNDADNYDDYGIDTRRTKITSNDVMQSLHNTLNPVPENHYPIQTVPQLPEIQQPTQSNSFEPLADLGIPYSDRIPSLQDTIAQEEADRLLAEVMTSTYGAEFNSPDNNASIFPDISSAQNHMPDYSCPSGNISPPRFRSNNQLVDSNNMNSMTRQYISSHHSPSNSYDKNYQNNNVTQRNVYNPNPMFRNPNPNSNQMLPGNMNNLNDNLDTIVKHELPSPPPRQMFNNWAPSGPNMTRTNSGMYLQHPTLGNSKLDNYMAMDTSGTGGDQMYHSDNNNSFPTKGIEGMSLLKQLEYNHNGYLNDVPIEPNLYGYGCQAPPPIQTDYP